VQVLEDEAREVLVPLWDDALGGVDEDGCVGRT